jgi:hypothetical protein
VVKTTGFANINAKAEGIETRPAFRKAFERRRCLVPVDNFYEWQKTRAGNRPMRSRWLIQGLTEAQYLQAALSDRFGQHGSARIPTGHRGGASGQDPRVERFAAEVRFAGDSPLEESGFELLVPLA